MTIIRNTSILIGVFVLATACATVQEKQALSEWNKEARKWTRSDLEDVDLPELDENASLDDYMLYAMLNNPGLRAAFDRWKAALDREVLHRHFLTLGLPTPTMFEKWRPALALRSTNSACPSPSPGLASWIFKATSRSRQPTLKASVMRPPNWS